MKWVPIIIGALGVLLLTENLLSTFSLQRGIDDLRAEVRAMQSSKGAGDGNVPDRLESKLGQHMEMHNALQSEVAAMQEDQKALHSLVVHNTKQMKEKLEEQVDVNEKISAKLDDHADAHKDMNAKLEAHATQHHEMTDKIVEAKESLSTKIEDHSKGLHAKLDAQKEIVTYELPGGMHLTTPWRVNGSMVYLDERYLFRIDGDGHVRFRAPGIDHVQIHVGSGNASRIEPLLESNKTLFIFAVSPFTPRESLAKSGRFVLIPSGVLHTPGYQKFKGKAYPVIRLEQLLQLINPSISVEVVKIYEGHDHFDMLSTGHFISQLPRVIMQLQDLPTGHPAKRPHVSNTTMAIHKMRQKGLHALCCKCLQADTWDLECYFARRGFTNITLEWPQDILSVSEPHTPDACHNPYDKQTNQALPASSWRKVWSVPMCRQSLGKTPAAAPAAKALAAAAAAPAA
jgi:hypothetical protein|mmetsp:Transcript_19934/g.34277  ORF Transcript_19934/g.34277 Transcript_19934/m.34277 type:complete len:457 (-) Transcript_19934:234-1604(-)|eukprot:CAMPEP_0174312764 /NCGR_PEP_ID=MMETSP0810-20121108/4506_1 /TAXON_ID=73025 ORGANISM="Eutreptiella gymnastica-like, Strain CCMP1594" /NCGR_SAMPLE_ID=MMETSP0810 /ASSEMBLY_ACC=CAM_ASM_000659 /LENGTH=456 /DNA_ID=CAMNT_0015421263 /DNA_START=48 /DNA_END=1418 /DNA_ORIENTATION=+